MVLSYYRNGSIRGSEKEEELRRILARAEQGELYGGQLLLDFEEDQLCIYESAEPQRRAVPRFWGPGPGVYQLEGDKRA